VEVALEKFNSTQSPVVYDVTVNTLDSAALTTDLGVSITGNKSSLNVGGTVKLTVKAFNNGPNGASVEVNYKIPIGLKLLSSQGAGTYDPETGVWSVGILPAGGNVTLELTLQANNAGAIVNTATVYSDLPDLNPLNNQAGFNLVTNAPNVEDIPEDELNGLPYTFPPDIKPPTPPTPPPGPTPPDTPPVPPTPPLPPSPPTPPGPGLGPSNPPKTQLDRDIDYVRKRVAYNPPAENTDENQTTQPPQMPEWKIDTNILIEILIATAMLATSAIAARFLNGGTENLKNSFGKWAVEKFGYDKPSIKSMVLYVISIGLFALDPGLVDGILLFVGMFGIFFDFIAAMMYSGAMDYFGYLLLSIALIKLVEKYWGLNIVQMAGDKLGKLKEIFTDELGPIFDHLKEMFGLK
jgi:hypothetical protein